MFFCLPVNWNLHCGPCFFLLPFWYVFCKNSKRGFQGKKMDTAVGRGFQILAHPLSSPFLGKSINQTPFSRSTSSWVVKKGLMLPRLHVVVRAQGESRPTWLPGLDPPPYLDGTWAHVVQLLFYTIQLTLQFNMKIWIFCYLHFYGILL